MKSIHFISGVILLFMLCAAKPTPYGSAKTTDPLTKIPAGTEPLLDYWMRDTYITLGDDGFYYLIGTTADPDRNFSGQTHCWDWNDGLYLFRSKDLSRWDSLGLIWSHKHCGTWQQEPKIFTGGEKFPQKSINGDPLDNRFHAVWAPELHYLKSQENWFIVACLNNSASGPGSFILRSTSGKPEGPYENIAANTEKPVFDNIDGSLFEDEDGTVYFVGHNHFIARMKADMSGFDEPVTRLKETAYSKEPYIEGACIFKHDGKYHLVQAIWSHRLSSGDETYSPETDGSQTRYSYDCIIATADHIYGPYSERYNAITGGGHNNFFCDKTGEWWATIFFNPRGAQAKEYAQTCRPGIVPMKYANGKFSPDNDRSGKLPLLLADPTIACFDGTYYLYGTESRPQSGFPVYVSQDLTSWKVPDLPNGHVLERGKSVYGKFGYWAPQIIKQSDNYKFLYTAEEHIALAESHSPLGIFTQKVIRPLEENQKTIDPFLFIDEDGRKFLYHVRLNKGNTIWVAELENDFSGIKTETLTQCITATEPWEDTQLYESAPIIEGPTVVKRGAYYYLFYSANHFMNIDYSVGYAVSKSPYGPWEKPANNPIIHRSIVGKNGSGHGDLFQDAQGNWKYVFHTHNNDSVVQPRRTFLVDVRYNQPDTSDYEVISVDKNTVRPLFITKK